MRAAKHVSTANRKAGLAASALLALATLALAGCESVQRRGLDPLAVSGRLTAAPVSYEALMRIGAAAAISTRPSAFTGAPRS